MKLHTIMKWIEEKKNKELCQSQVKRLVSELFAFTLVPGANPKININLRHNFNQCGEPPRPRAGQASPGRRCPNPRPQVWAGQAISAQNHTRAGQAGYYVPTYLLSVDLVLIRASAKIHQFLTPIIYHSMPLYQQWMKQWAILLMRRMLLLNHRNKMLHSSNNFKPLVRNPFLNRNC